MRKLRAIYLSQVRLFARDRVTVLITVLLPLVLGVFFGYIFGPSASSPMRIVVVNEDSGAAAAAVVEGITSQRTADLRVATDTYGPAMQKLQEGETDLVIVVPSGFSEQVARKVPTTITASVNSQHGVNAGVASLAAQAIIAKIDRQLSGTGELIRLQQVNIAARVPSLAEFYVPNFLAISMLWLSIFATALPLVKQRESGCLLRISIAPVSKTTFMAGVTLWRLTVGVVQSALFIAVAMLTMGSVDTIRWLPLAACVLLGNLVFTVMGYMIAGLSRTVSSAEGIAQAFNFGFLFLSGVFFTSDMLPGAIRSIADAIPLAYLADMLRQLLVGYPPLFPLWLDFAVLGGAGLVFTLLALRTWRWQ
jgi:ABC-2 type transport system permease protein